MEQWEFLPSTVSLLRPPLPSSQLTILSSTPINDSINRFFESNAMPLTGETVSPVPLQGMFNYNVLPGAK